MRTRSSRGNSTTWPGAGTPGTRPEESSWRAGRNRGRWCLLRHADGGQRLLLLGAPGHRQFHHVIAGTEWCKRDVGGEPALAARRVGALGGHDRDDGAGAVAIEEDAGPDRRCGVGFHLEADALAAREDVSGGGLQLVASHRTAMEHRGIAAGASRGLAALGAGIALDRSERAVDCLTRI